MIGNSDNYISDHNGVNIIIDATSPDKQHAKFNIITHNLEGLCYRNVPAKDIRFIQVVNNLCTYFEPYINIVPILILQELALQLHKKDIDKQSRVLQNNMELILDKLSPINSNLTATSESYTGCMIYDTTVWECIDFISINRIGSPKYSNGYLMKFLACPLLHLWIINIHLKAYGATMKTQAQINGYHINELTNIIDTVMTRNKDEYPIYLCGDFNNGTEKSLLVMESLNLIPHSYKVYLDKK